MPRRGKHQANQIHRVDLHVGQRIRVRRVVLGISQTTLANAIGLTFQQVQKYESGHNRVSASMLFDIAKALRCNAGFFFEELEETAQKAEGEAEQDPMQTTEALAVVGSFNKLREDQKTAVMDVMAAMRLR